MEEVFKPNNWKDLQEILFFDSWDSNINRFRSSYIYRGMNDKSFNLQTSLMRLGGPFRKLEKHLIRNFMKYAHRNPLPGESAWNWLALAQHHGLPTRLLDWTYSPYIAMHFATNELSRYKDDGVIYALNYVAMNESLPDKLLNIIKKEQSNTFTASMLDSVCKDLSDIEDLESEFNQEFLIFLEPPSLDDRIINQFALFSFLSNPSKLLDHWLKDHEQHFFKIIIKKELKWEIRDKLDQANITERVLFPGLDGLSLWLKRHYSSKDVSY